VPRSRSLCVPEGANYGTNFAAKNGQNFVQDTNVTDNLLVVVIVHGLYDFLVLLYLLRGPGSTTPTEESGIKDQEAEVEGPKTGESTEY
jgi:hypothetical protein